MIHVILMNESVITIDGNIGCDLEEKFKIEYTKICGGPPKIPPGSYRLSEYNNYSIECKNWEFKRINAIREISGCQMENKNLEEGEYFARWLVKRFGMKIIDCQVYRFDYSK